MRSFSRSASGTRWRRRTTHLTRRPWPKPSCPQPPYTTCLCTECMCAQRYPIHTPQACLRRADALPFAMSDSSFHPTSREEYLAQELAAQLDDPAGLPFYRTITHRYAESFIRQMLGRVLEVPPAQIRKSRAALFNW